MPLRRGDPDVNPAGGRVGVVGHQIGVLPRVLELPDQAPLPPEHPRLRHPRRPGEVVAGEGQVEGAGVQGHRGPVAPHHQVTPPQLPDLPVKHLLAGFGVAAVETDMWGRRVGYITGVVTTVILKSLFLVTLCVPRISLVMVALVAGSLMMLMTIVSIVSAMLLVRLVMILRNSVDRGLLAVVGNMVDELIPIDVVNRGLKL